MIPIAYITEWQVNAPWQSPEMIEQDLVISRALLDIYSDPFLQDRLAFRGGTAIYKLCLLPAARYSEDIDLVQLNAEPIRETLDHLHAALDSWLGIPSYTSTPQSAKLLYRFDSETTPGLRQRLKVEINTREHLTAYATVRYPFTIQSRWVQGTAEIVSFSLDELLGTKLRALYQRKKGRDLFDLDYALRFSDVLPDRIIGAFIQYVGRQGLRITARQFRSNLRTKLTDQQFGMDILPLLRGGISFDAEEAVERIETKLIRLLDQALVDIEVMP